jgi:hypothetical protein
LSTDLSKDLVFDLDVAAMREDPILSKVWAKSEASSNAEVGALLQQIDRLSMRASLKDERGHFVASNYVAVVWGHLGTDPRRFEGALAAEDGEFSSLAPLTSGVSEYVKRSRDVHVFVLSDRVWVATQGAATDNVRARLAKSSAPPPVTKGPVAHVSLNAAVLDKGRGLSAAFKGLDRLDLVLDKGASSAKAEAMFRSEDEATTSATLVKKLVDGLSAAVALDGGECKALQKLHADVAHAGRTLKVEIKGIADAADAWDPAVCGATAAPVAKHAYTDEKLCGRLEKQKIPNLVHTRGWSNPNAKHAQEAARIKQVEEMFSGLPESSQDHTWYAAELLSDYSVWIDSVKRACESNPMERASAEDLAVAEQVAKRVRTLCKEIRGKKHHGPPMACKP